MKMSLEEIAAKVAAKEEEVEKLVAGAKLIIMKATVLQSEIKIKGIPIKKRT